MRGARRDPIVALTRFGLGARPGDADAVGRDPVDWARAQLVPHHDVPEALRGLPGTAEIVAEAASARDAGEDAKKELRRRHRDLYVREAEARSVAMIASDRPLEERLVAFFSNHFTVSVAKPVVTGGAGAFEREAIRPHAVGRFDDMLLAVARHPAMLVYLDNQQSIGPGSRVGARHDEKGLNENLAREMLELHTLGVDGGYTQDDVVALAKLITGWTVDTGQEGRTGAGGGDGFRFADNRHEPGPKTLLGKVYDDGGYDEGKRAILDLAHHPATARHLARKLVAHFVADDPPADVVAACEKTFLESGGHIGQTVAVLLEQDAAWDPEPKKLKSPFELVTSAARALGYTADGRQVVRSLERLGQPVWTAPSPAGWPDDAASWAGPQAILDRVAWAEDVGVEMARRVRDPGKTAGDVLGGRLADATSSLLKRADAGRAIGLLVACPEFQRR